MKVIGFSGSPRKGHSTDQLVEKMLEGAKKTGAETKFYNISEMNITDCKSCYMCRKVVGECSIKDDMQEIIAEIKSSDAVIVGSPIYMMQMTSQTKKFSERLFPLITPDFKSILEEGKKLQCVFTQGDKDTEKFRNYFDYNETVFELCFDVEKTFVVGGTMMKDDLAKQKDVIEKAIEIGTNLAS